MWPSEPQMWLSHGCCQGSCASRQECGPRCGPGWRWQLEEGTELLQEGRGSEKERGLLFGFPKNVQRVPRAGGRFVQINIPPSRTHTSALHAPTPLHSILTLLQVLTFTQSDLCLLGSLVLGYLLPHRGGQWQLPLSPEQGEAPHFSPACHHLS